MDKFELQKLRDLPIEGVAERLGLHVVRHKALCPYSSITACYCAIRMGYLGREKYFKKYLKKSAEIFGNMEFILYLCNVFER